MVKKCTLESIFLCEDRSFRYNISMESINRSAHFLLSSGQDIKCGYLAKSSNRRFSKMIVRCWVVYLLLHLTCKVSLQNSANNFDRVVGDSVTLPCIYENQQPSTDVFWRLNVSKRVLNIIDGKPSTEKQDEMFKNRTESFPSEYAKGNYSIELKDLKLTHAGNYTCFLQKSNEEKKMQLFVKEKPQKPTQKQRNSCLETESLKIMTLLTALLGLTMHLI